MGFLMVVGLAIFLRRVLPSEVSDDLYSVFSTLVLVSLLLLCLAIVNLATLKASRKFLCVMSVVAFVVASIGYLFSWHRSADPVIFSPALLFPLGLAIFLSLVIIMIFRRRDG